MNRRSFFGFACGGIVAAPAAVLAGTEPIQAQPKKADVAQLSVEVNFDMDGNVKAYIEQASRDAAREMVERYGSREAAQRVIASQRG